MAAAEGLVLMEAEYCREGHDGPPPLQNVQTEQMLALHRWRAMLLFIPVTAVPVSARRKGH